MYLKIANPLAHLPHLLTIRGKAYLFGGSKAPSVCVEEFDQATGEAMLKSYPKLYSIATPEEVAEARKQVQESSATITMLPGALKPDTVISGALRVEDFDAVPAGEVSELLSDAKVPLEMARQLLAHTQALGNRKKVEKALVAHIQSLEASRDQ